MKTYRVGGYVRDSLLGITPKDVDYCVVGSTKEEMKELGFKRVGADFPVFFHAITHDEYALARRERKVGEGYLGFECEFDPSVTIEEDLARRDLTINAMALDEDENLIDPYGGKQDCENKVFRHVDGFHEDPVRVLRLARFAARYPDFTVAPETEKLIQDMADRGTLDELQEDRIWKEFSRAMKEKDPTRFFRVLLETGALEKIFPDIFRLKAATENLKWHPEGDAFEHTMLVLRQSLDFDFDTRMAALVHDLGKGLTPKEELPKHHGHDVKGAKLVKKFCERYRVPSSLSKSLALVTRFHMNMHRLHVLNPKTFVKMFDEMGAVHDTKTVWLLLRLGLCDALGRAVEVQPTPQELEEHFSPYTKALNAYLSVKFEEVFDGKDVKNRSGESIKQEMYKSRVRAIKEAFKNE